jgi:hypothetical protein
MNLISTGATNPCWIVRKSAAADRQETTMRKLILLVGLAFALAAGTMMTIYSEPTLTDTCSGSDC